MYAKNLGGRGIRELYGVSTSGSGLIKSEKSLVNATVGWFFSFFALGTPGWNAANQKAPAADLTDPAIIEWVQAPATRAVGQTVGPNWKPKTFASVEVELPRSAHCQGSCRAAAQAAASPSRRPPSPTGQTINGMGQPPSPRPGHPATSGSCHGAINLLLLWARWCPYLYAWFAAGHHRCRTIWPVALVQGPERPRAVRQVIPAEQQQQTNSNQLVELPYSRA